MFATLGLAGVAMVALSAARMTDLGAGSEGRIVARSGQMEAPAVATNVSISGPAHSRIAPREAMSGKVRSAGNSGLSLLLR